MSSARKILANTAVQIFAKVATAACSIVIIKLLTGYLGVAGYGEYTTIYEFLAFFAIAADFGIFQVAVREMTHTPARAKQIFDNILSLRILLSLGAMLAAVVAVFFVPKYSGTAIPAGVVVASITTFLTLIFGTLSSVLQFKMRMEWNAAGLILAKFLTLGWMAATIFVWLPDDPAAGFEQLLIAGIVGNAAMVLLAAIAAWRLQPFSLAFDLQLWKKILKKTLPYGTAVLLATIYFRVDVILLSLIRSSEEVGIYGVGMRVVENLQMLPVFFLNSALPKLTEFFRDNRQKLLKMLQLSFDFLMLLGVPIVFGGIALAYPLTAAISDPEFLSNAATGFIGSDVALQILLAAMLLAFCANLFNYSLLAGGEQRRILIVNSAAVAFNLVANLIVIPRFGFVGAATTSVLSEIFVCLASFFFLRQLTSFVPKFKTFAKIILAASVMVATVLWLQPIFFAIFGGNISLAFVVPIGGAVYGVVLILLRTITPEMWKLLRKRV